MKRSWNGCIFHVDIQLGKPEIMLTLKKCGSRIGKLLVNQMQKADRFANKNMFLLAETGKGNRKTDSRCFGTAIGFSVYRTQDCYQYLRFAIYFIRGIRGHPPNKMGFCTAKSVSCRGLAQPVRTPWRK